jgi:hypothetical protein
MHRGWLFIGIAFVFCVSVVAHYLHILDRVLLCANGLRVEWSFGATSTQPSATVFARWKGKEIECPFYFGGIDDADIRFFDANRDGYRDIVFGNEEKTVIVGVLPGTTDRPPSFKLIKDNTGTGLNP